jgi:hypothetical protein
MPVVRYFFSVGAALLTLLFVVDAYLPKSPPVERAIATADLSIIRIRSDRKWPERVVFDTTLPTVTPALTRTAETNIPAPAPVAEPPAKVRVREALAQLPQSNPELLQPADPRRVEPKPQRKRKTAARGYIGPPTILVAQQPRFGLFGNATW